MTYTDEFLSYVRRFRTFRDYGLTVTEAHDLVTEDLDTGLITEEKFFLYWKASESL